MYQTGYHATGYHATQYYRVVVVVVSEASSSGGYGSLNSYNAWRQRERRRRADLDEIENEIDRAIALELEALAADGKRIEAVSELMVSVDQAGIDAIRKEFSSEIAEQIERTIRQRTRRSIAKLDRQLDEVEEQEFLLIVASMVTIH